MRHRAHAPTSAGVASVRSSTIERPDALDEDLLERRIGDLEPEDLVAAADGRAEDRLRIGPGIDVELGEVAARPRDADVGQRSEPLELAAGRGGDADDLVAGRVLDVPRRAASSRAVRGR